MPCLRLDQPTFSTDTGLRSRAYIPTHNLYYYFTYYSNCSHNIWQLKNCYTKLLLTVCVYSVYCRFIYNKLTPGNNN